MIQKRTTTVISAQPLSSKWWWSGLIRKMRLPRVSLKYDPLQDDRAGPMTNRPPMRIEQQLGAGQDRRARRGRRRSPSEPVSPMKICAGRRVPPEEADEGADDRGRDDREVERVAHVVAAGRRRSGRGSSLQQDWLNCQKPMRMYAPIAKIAGAARRARRGRRRRSRRSSARR